MRLYFDFHSGRMLDPQKHSRALGEISEWTVFDQIARYYRSLAPTTTFVYANSKNTLLTWTNFVVTQNRKNLILWDYNHFRKPKGKIKIPPAGRMVVILSLKDRANEVRNSLKKSKIPWREIREKVPYHDRYMYTIFILGFWK